MKNLVKNYLNADQDRVGSVTMFTKVDETAGKAQTLYSDKDCTKLADANTVIELFVKRLLVVAFPQTYGDYAWTELFVPTHVVPSLDSSILYVYIVGHGSTYYNLEVPFVVSE